MFLDILNRYFKGFYMPKTPFLKVQKKFSVQNFFWDFLYMYKGGLCKKTLVVATVKDESGSQ